MPFRYGIPPSDDIKLMLTVKLNISLFDEEVFKRKKEMRKLLMVHVKETNITYAFPILLTIAKPPAPQPKVQGYLSLS